jgi:hypothetical protein
MQRKQQQQQQRHGQAQDYLLTRPPYLHVVVRLELVPRLVQRREDGGAYHLLLGSSRLRDLRALG